MIIIQHVIMVTEGTMDNKVLSGLLNPVRMRIMQILIVNETASARAIAEELPDIPIASLYRHINKLVNDGILEICSENKIRGTVEKIYRLKSNPLQEMNDKVQKGSKDEMYNVFYTFVMTQLMDFNSYLNNSFCDLERDKVGFRSFPFYLSDEESDEFLNDLKNAILKIKDNKPGEGRKLRKFSFVIMPAEETEGGKKK